MKKKIAIAFEVVLAVIFILLSVSGTVESFIYQVGAVLINSVFWVCLSCIFQKKINHKYAYFIPEIFIIVISFPILIILMIVSGGWAILGYGIILGLIIISLLFIIPFYWIIDCK
jgi:hypothetical protein